MHADKSTNDERTTTTSAANSSQHNISHKSTKLFGLLTKRPSKVEPQQQHPSPSATPDAQTSKSSSLLSSSHQSSSDSKSCIIRQQKQQQQQQQQQHDLSFAKCTPERKATILATAAASNHQALSNNNAATVTTKAKSQTLPAASASAASQLNNNLEKSQSSSSSVAGILNINYRKSRLSKSKAISHRHSADLKANVQIDGSIDGGDGGSAMCDVIRRTKSPKKRSPNHNRFSHQFSLCCKAEKKPLTPPVTVRYNSIPDATINLLRRDNLSLSWSLVDNASLSINSSEDASQLNYIYIQQPGKEPTTTTTTNSAKNSKHLHLECASAPQSPVTAKVVFAALNANNSPSNSSLKSTQSDQASPSPHDLISNDDSRDSLRHRRSAVHVNNRTPIRPISVAACRSRLRLKLYPPGKEALPPPLPLPLDNSSSVPAAAAAYRSNNRSDATESIRHATTPQHMSSPNIATQKDVAFATNPSDEHGGVRFMSQENIRTIQRQSSSSGLARNALMAAQVLSLIPTENARERSYLNGRLGSCSLLGPSELNRVLPSRQVTIFVGTWNMNGQSPPKQMNDFVLPMTVEHVPDIVAIGTQESSPDRYEWEVTLQETLGPSHVLFHSMALGTLHLAILMRRDLIWYCSAPEDASLSVRTGSAFRTKGAVAISFCLFGTSMLFVTSHLTAHQQKVKERVSDVKRIIHALDLPKNLNLRHKSKDVTQNFDNVFWCGDLNFRLGEPREKLLEWIQNTKFPLPSHLPHGYMHTDQLSSVLSDGAAFRGFMEANITFPPTYKYDPGTQYFDTSSKQRAPAYTDRILYKYRQIQGLTLRRQSMMLPNALLGNAIANDASNASSVQPYVECLLYDSVPSITTSDHKPVWALFKTLIRAGTDSIPLAAGLFNRDIYLEGLKRRLNNQYSGSSAVCSIQ